MTTGHIRRRIRADRGRSTGLQQVKAFLRSTVSYVNVSLNLGPILCRQRTSRNEHLPPQNPTPLLYLARFRPLFVAFLRFMRRRIVRIRCSGIDVVSRPYQG